MRKLLTWLVDGFRAETRIVSSESWYEKEPGPDAAIKMTKQLASLKEEAEEEEKTLPRSLTLDERILALRGIQNYHQEKADEAGQQARNLMLQRLQKKTEGDKPSVKRDNT
jgi:hypothetical protein